MPTNDGEGFVSRVRRPPCRNGRHPGVWGRSGHSPGLLVQAGFGERPEPVAGTGKGQGAALRPFRADPSRHRQPKTRTSGPDPVPTKSSGIRRTAWHATWKPQGIDMIAVRQMPDAAVAKSPGTQGFGRSGQADPRRDHETGKWRRSGMAEHAIQVRGCTIGERAWTQDCQCRCGQLKGSTRLETGSGIQRRKAMPPKLIRAESVLHESG